MITSYEFLLTPWFFETSCKLQTDLLCYLLACLPGLCNLFCRHVHGLKVTNSTILAMEINIFLKWKLTFVQTSRFTDVISDNDSKRVWKTFLFLQTCSTRKYNWIKMLELTDVFSRVPFTKRTVYLLFTAHLQTRRWLLWRHFHPPMWDHTKSVDLLFVGPLVS